MLASCNSKTESSEETVKILIEAGADVNLYEEDGWTALMLASRNSKTGSSEETVKILLEAGAIVTKETNEEIRMIVRLQQEIITSIKKGIESHNIFNNAMKNGYNVVESVILSYYPYDIKSDDTKMNSCQ